jgi:diguanylate cyclase (GGDEF)-like protein
VETASFPNPGAQTSPYVTVSVGVACCAASRDTTPEQLPRQADKALYRAKQSGRNRVVLYETGSFGG